MDASQLSHVGLFRAILSIDPQADLFHELLSPWIAGEREWLTAFEQQTSPEPIEIDDSWRLYALSRINQILLMAFQRGTHDIWEGPALTMPEYLAFMTGLGFRVVDEPAYSPFFHEIVEVVEADGTSPRQDYIDLERVDWPALMLGPMMFSRAGVAVSCVSGALQPEIATSSTLYWAHRRKYRPREDLADGWGSNSQWATQFRRDYILGDKLLFNADGKYDLNDSGLRMREDGLTRAERIELLTHGCFVRCEKPDNDLDPYSDRILLPRDFQ
ncbi:hypothetical protein [Variovorax sp. R-27]|uniref:hypothetical protein n=1 Tax=unclassified Variovorax TaxID=663243 RepID=UPI003CF4413C